MPVQVGERLFDEYYNGCCNETYWPLFHSMPDRAVFNREHWRVSLGHLLYITVSIACDHHHDLPRSSLQAYQDVNEIFGLKTMEAIRRMNQIRFQHPVESRPEPPLVWIHDYHLMLAANTIRYGLLLQPPRLILVNSDEISIRDSCVDEGIEVRIGFFLHIPFPSFDIIRIFPWVDEILMGMLGLPFFLHQFEHGVKFKSFRLRFGGLSHRGLLP